MKRKKWLGLIPFLIILLLIPITTYALIIIKQNGSVFITGKNYFRLFFNDRLTHKVIFDKLLWPTIIGALISFISLIPKKLFIDKWKIKYKNTIFYTALISLVFTYIWISSYFPTYSKLIYLMYGIVAEITIFICFIVWYIDMLTVKES